MSNRRSGFTITEALVSIAILGLLIAILAPAVQSVRQSSRKIECTAHLHEMGVAIASYETAHGRFPSGLKDYKSLHTTLLPHLGYQGVYDLFDETVDDFTLANVKLQRSVVPVFLCPSDPAPNRVANSGMTNYLGNAGSGVQEYGYNGMFNHEIGGHPYFSEGPIRAADVDDGLSNTAMMAEIRHADGSFDRLRVAWDTPEYHETVEELARVCEGVPPVPPDYGWTGANIMGFWYHGDVGPTLYTHVLQPNKPSCLNKGDPQSSAFTAGSLHPGGANLLYADGRIKFISDSVDRGVWRELGSRKEKVLTPEGERRLNQ